jgi:hypothetical protein
LLWRFGKTRPNGKREKIPCHHETRRSIDHTDPAALLPFDRAYRASLSIACDGLGFSFQAEDCVVGIDLDDCRNPETGTIHPAAEDIILRGGTYGEISPSLEGVKLWGIGSIDPEPNRGVSPAGFGLEVYDRQRFFTVTGWHCPGTPFELGPVGEIARELQAVILAAKPRPSPPRQPISVLGSGFKGDDEALLHRAWRASNGEEIRQLWSGDRTRYKSPSEALLALANQLAYWAGHDEDRLERLILTSPLVAATEGERRKWYSPRQGSWWGRVYVVRPAIRDCRRFYSGSVSPSPLSLGNQDTSYSSGTRTPPTVEALCATGSKEEDWPKRVMREAAWGASNAGLDRPGIVLAVCRAIAGISPGGRFHLAGRLVEEVTGIPHRSAARLLVALVGDGRLVLVKKGKRSATERNASEYRLGRSSKARAAA